MALEPPVTDDHDSPPAPAELVTPIPPAANASESKLVEVAVIGDVGTDWIYISDQPSQSAGTQGHPWTQQPATSLFALPGGAWLSGHMIQGALAAPVFYRRYLANILRSGKDSPASVTLSGALKWAPVTSLPKGDAYVITIRFLPATNDDLCSTVILDDADEYLTDEFESVTIKIARNAYMERSRVELGAIEAALWFEQEDEPQPGRILVDQLGRCFSAQNVTVHPPRPRRRSPLPDKKSLECTYLTIRDTECTVVLQKPSQPGSPAVSMERRVSSVRIMPRCIRQQRLALEPTLLVSTNTKMSTLFFSKATIDVTYGNLSITTKTIDTGKLNPPSLQGIQTGKSKTENDELTVKLTRCKHVSGPADDAMKVHALRPLGGDHAIWFYTNPGVQLSMQRPSHIVHTLSEVKLHAGPGGQRVYRREKSKGVNGPTHGYPTVLGAYRHNTFFTCTEQNSKGTPANCSYATWKSAGNRKIVIVDNLGYGFCSRLSLWQPFLLSSEHLAGLQNGNCSVQAACDEIRKNADLKAELVKFLANTWIVIKASHWLSPDTGHFIEFLRECEASDRTIVVVSAESLRTGFISPSDHPGIKLSKTVSWERTFDDLHSAILEGKLDSLLPAKHLVVRFGLEGAIHFQRTSAVPEVVGAGNRLEPKSGLLSLLFDAERIEGEYAIPEHGELPGITTAFVAGIIPSICRSLQPTTEKPLDEAILDGIKFALRSARRYFDLGYGPTPETVRKFEYLQLPITQVFGSAPIDACRNRGEHSFRTYKVEVNSASQTSGVVNNSYSVSSRSAGDWSILTRQLESRSAPIYTHQVEGLSPDEKAAIGRGTAALSLARKIVTLGPDAAFAESRLDFPFAKFGELLTVSRREIEGFRGLRNLFAEYIGHPDRREPLSIAVFGPPGSGKSFGVRQIAKQVVRDGHVQEFVINLAQLKEFRDVSRLLLMVRDSTRDEKKPPLVFFDEFDATLGTAPLGWLRFFLSPMQDGKFQHDGNMFEIGKAIFVFAGGIASTHSKFASEAFWSRRAGGPGNQGIFGSAKGRDFHSRLRGFLEIVGPNPRLVQNDRKAETSDEFVSEDFTFVIRRALLVRQILERMARNSERALLDVDERLEVDSDVKDALLLARRYKHGVRSLQAIIEMSGLHGERIFSKTALPSHEQCLMHVDRSFASILRRNYFELKSNVLRSICIVGGGGSR